MKSPSTKSILLASLAAIAVAGFAIPNAEAGHDDNRLIRMSHSLEDLTGELREEFRAHYRHTSAYRHLVADANRIEAEAEHIHRLAHDPYASLRHIAEDLEDLDELAHHLHELVDDTERGRYGHVHGSTRHVHEMLTSLNRLIHAMEEEVEDLRHHDIHHDHYDRGHGHGHGHREGVTFQRGGFRISLYR